MSKIYPACHFDVNGIKPGSNSIMSDKHTAEHSKTACLGIYWPVSDVRGAIDKFAELLYYLNLK